MHQLLLVNSFSFIVDYPPSTMTNKTLLKKAALITLAIGSGLAVQMAFSQSMTAQTTESGRTLQDLQGSATSESPNTLETLRDRAAQLEAERSSRTPNYTGNSADSTTTEAAATGGNEGAIAKLSPETGFATVMLTNNTGDDVNYEAIGQTAPRTLAAGASAQLDNLPMPITITAERQNFGLVDMMVTVGDNGVLNVTLEQSEFDEVQGAMRISEDGFVFVN